jgi:hypothetical protein
MTDSPDAALRPLDLYPALTEKHSFSRYQLSAAAASGSYPWLGVLDDTHHFVFLIEKVSVLLSGRRERSLQAQAAATSGARRSSFPSRLGRPMRRG